MNQFSYRLGCGRIVNEDFDCESECCNEPICYFVNKKEKLKVYVSLPITGRDMNDVKKQLEEARIELEASNLIVVTPFDMKDWEPDKPWEWYIVRCLHLMFDVRYIYLCDGWENSLGCRTEVEYARLRGIEILDENK